MATLIAHVVTPAARRWLAHTTAARVLNVFERACNLINQDNDVLALVTSERGLTPFGVVVGAADSAPFETVHPHSLVLVNGDGLTVGELAIQTGLASLWEPTPDWAALRTMFRADPTQLAPLVRIALEFKPEASLLEIYSTGEGPRPSAMFLSVLNRIQQAVPSLTIGLKEQSVDHCARAARQMAGAGGGLTPAGDDFLVGVMLAVWAGLWGSGREGLVATLADTAAPLTSALSGAYLRAAARGECIAHWHRLFAALHSPDVEVIRMAAKTLMSVGHTSGADGLAGFVLAHIAGL